MIEEYVYDGFTIGTEVVWDDIIWTPNYNAVYKVTTVDIHGNESEGKTAMLPQGPPDNVSDLRITVERNTNVTHLGVFWEYNRDPAQLKKANLYVNDEFYMELINDYYYNEDYSISYGLFYHVADNFNSDDVFKVTSVGFNGKESEGVTAMPEIINNTPPEGVTELVAYWYDGPGRVTLDFRLPNQDLYAAYVYLDGRLCTEVMYLEGRNGDVSYYGLYEANDKYEEYTMKIVLEDINGNKNKGQFVKYIPPLRPPDEISSHHIKIEQYSFEPYDYFLDIVWFYTRNPDALKAVNIYIDNNLYMT